MSAITYWALLAALTVVFVPVMVLLLQVVCAILPRRPAPLAQVTSPRLAVIVPAHNESAGIMATLELVLKQLKDGDRVVVVADNCMDDTAQVAAAAGAEVVERHDMLHRGKGYALDFGVRYLERNPPELVVIIDADCEVMPGSIDRIARLSAARGRPIQALYLMRSPPPAGAMAQIAEFAWIVNTLVRPLGFLRLGLPCRLMGTGMAIPWAAMQAAPLASGHIVEDMQMSIDFARAGAPPLFCPEALVLSYFPTNDEGARSQRTRWEHGHLSMTVGQAPRLFLEGFGDWGSGLLALAFDMCVPPLALLTLIVVAAVGLSAAHALLTPSVAPLVLAGVILMMLIVAVSLSWLRFGREVIRAATLLLAFVYVLRKVPLYFRFLVRRQVEWVRSKRDGN